jgi:gliding motility-associated-like protein
MIKKSTQIHSGQGLCSFIFQKDLLITLSQTFSNHKRKIVLGAMFILLTMSTQAATIYFNTIYKATGTSYTINTQSLTNIQLVSGSGFRFTSIIPSATSFTNGNNEAGTLEYINAAGVPVSITGSISRQNKSGNTTLAVNFITSTGGEAYVLVVPTKEGSFSAGGNVTTSSDPIDTVLNALLASQASLPTISVSSPSITEGTDLYAEFTVTLSQAANAGTTFTPVLNAGTATLTTDYTASFEYYNGSSWVSLPGAYTIAQGATSVRIRVPIVNDATYEPTENFVLKTGTVTGSNVLNNGGAFGSATVLDDDAPNVPTVIYSGTLSPMSACFGSASSAQTFTVSGVVLSANIVVTAPTGYEVSLDGTNFFASVSIAPTSNTVASTTIYVRLTSTATNGASGNIAITSTGATTENVATGTAVVNALPTVIGTTGGSNVGTGTVNLSGTASSGATLDWYDAASGGNLLGSGTSFTTPSISSTTTYYAEARNTTTGCISSARTAVVATISGPADSDGDGVTDAQELLDGTDPNNGCSYNLANQVLANTSPAWRSSDCDGDGKPNGTDSSPLNFCVDGSGSVPLYGTAAYEFYRDGDCDGDQIPNGLECHNSGGTCEDFDNDGTPDYLDNDSDNDGILDFYEKYIDSDGDGRMNYVDLDSDNDGILDSRETASDSDGDGTPNYLDLDSDGDSILDSFEGLIKFRNQTDSNNNGRVDCTIDANGNGLMDCVETAMGGSSVEVPDTDGDGRVDFLDLDSDNDGINDNVELRGDPDGDGLPNYRDLDSDGDKLADQAEGSKDQDGDGTPNFLDLDSDGDGILDRIEGPTACVTCTDRVDNNDDGFDDRSQFSIDGWSVDTDKDGLPDFLDIDSDNDGIPDAVEAGSDPLNPVDTDKDGMPDFRDLDSDNDGIPDSIEAGNDPAVPVDTDKDGTPDFRDLDSDNDGITDEIEAGIDPKNPLDTDGDGIYDFRETDSDNDGILDSIEKGPTATPIDTDKDGLPDYRDIDSDNDGILDNIEKGSTATPVDTDGDGTPDFRDLDSDNDGISDNIEKGPSATPVDTDGDGTADFRDLDSDNDGILDNTEKGPSATPIDTDGDGTADFRDVDSDNDGISDNIEKGPTANPIDTDGDGLPDYRDLDSDNDTISDNIEKGPTSTPVDTDKDGNADYRDLDSDNDGITDKVEAGPDPKNPLDTDKDLTYDFRDTDSDNDGILDKDEDNINLAGLADCDNDGIPNRLDADKCPTFIPQGISPNGDGKNDTFIIPGILNAQPNTLTIFNRWGNIVYEKDNYQNDWHGQTDRAFDLLASDGLLPDGTYYYVIDFKGNKSNVKSFIYVNRLDK